MRGTGKPHCPEVKNEKVYIIISDQAEVSRLAIKINV